MRRTVTAALALACWWAAAISQESAPQPPEASPDLEFLEYLGAWAEEDDEWLAIEEWRKDIEAEAGEESETEREDDDESE